MQSIGLGLTGLAGVGILIIGLLYLLRPLAIASSFGFTAIPESGQETWLRVKGVRDATCGLVAFVLLLTAPPAVIGWVLLTFALIPLGDAANVIGSRGHARAAWAIHVPTATLMLIGAILLLMGSR